MPVGSTTVAVADDSARGDGVLVGVRARDFGVRVTVGSDSTVSVGAPVAVTCGVMSGRGEPVGDGLGEGVNDSEEGVDVVVVLAVGDAVGAGPSGVPVAVGTTVAGAVRSSSVVGDGGAGVGSEVAVSVAVGTGVSR